MKWARSKGAIKCARCYETSIETGSADHMGKKRFFARTENGRGKSLTKGARAFVVSGFCKYGMGAALKMTGHAMATNWYIKGKDPKPGKTGGAGKGLDAPLTHQEADDGGGLGGAVGRGRRRGQGGRGG